MINYLFEKKLNFFFLIFFVISFFFGIYKVLEDFNKIDIFFQFNSQKKFFIIILIILVLKITSYRYYYFLKKLTKYSHNYNNWCKLFFQTTLMNLFFQGSGHLLRAIKLKKKNVNYSQFVSINYAFFFLVFIFNFLLFLLFLYFITEKKIIILIFFVLLGITLIITRKEFYFFLIIFLNKKFKFLNNRYKNAIKRFLIDSNNFFLKKNLLIFLLFTLLIFCLEFLSFNLIISNFFFNIDFYFVMLIFILIFCLNKIPILTNFIGLNETIAGLFLENLGFYFVHGFFIQLSYRIFTLISAIFCTVLYYLISLKNSS